MRTPNDEWNRASQAVMAHGQLAQPRGLWIRERLAFQTDIDMSNPILTNSVRKIGYKFMLAEAYWILTGQDNLEFIGKYSKDIAKFSDDGQKFFGAYGPKISSQLENVVEILRKDRDTRQAVINIWRENPPASKDIPCTISVQWLIRGNKLYCVDTMRSSDLWLGWPYDIFNFSILSIALLILLRNKGMPELELGRLYLNSGSLHIYKHNEAGFKEAQWDEHDPFVNFKLDPSVWSTVWDFTSSIQEYLDKGAYEWFDAHKVPE